MNNGLYMTPNFISNQGSSTQVPNLIPSQSSSAPDPNMGIGYQYGYNQRDYAENLFKANIGKRIEVYVSFADSIEWRDSIFRGILEDAGRDFLLIRDEGSNKRYVLWNVYLDYVVFEGEVNK